MELTSELYDPVNAAKTHNVKIYSIKNLPTERPASKTFIKYNSNDLEENDEEEKEPIDIELTEQKQILIMMKLL